MPTHESSISVLSIITPIALAALVALVTRKLKLLTFGGALAAFVIGAVIFASGKMLLAVPLLAFFLSSSLLSVVGKSRKASANSHYAKSGERDAWQVCANGLIPAALAAVYALNPYVRQIVLVYFASLAAVNADTWATEIGGLSPNPRMISNWRKAPAGVSGAISLLGLAGAFLGSAFIVFAGWLVWNPGKLMMWKPDISEMLAVTWSGFLAAWADSILGASVQAQYRCTVCQAQTERKIHCGKPTKHVSGLKWINNDTVNFIACLLGVLFCWFLFHYYAYPE
jgi:uncharacterized protein (TIGR00297 family)